MKKRIKSKRKKKKKKGKRTRKKNEKKRETQKGIHHLFAFERIFIILSLVAAGVSNPLRECRYSTDCSWRLSQAFVLIWVCS